NNIQEYINQNFADKQIKAIGLIYIEDLIPQAVKLTGELIIQDYPQLEVISLANHELTSLTITNCSNLKEVNVRNNQLTKLEITGSNQISTIIAGQNQLETLNCSDCSELKRLVVPDNPLLSEIKGLN